MAEPIGPTLSEQIDALRDEIARNDALKQDYSVLGKEIHASDKSLKELARAITGQDTAQMRLDEANA